MRHKGIRYVPSKPSFLNRVRRVLLALVGGIFGLAIAVFVGVVTVVGVAAALGLACLVSLIPLFLLGLLLLWGGLVDRVWMRLEIHEPKRQWNFTFPLPLSLIRLTSKSRIHVNGREVLGLEHLPWRELRQVLREEPLMVEIRNPQEAHHIVLCLGPKGELHRWPEHRHSL